MRLKEAAKSNMGFKNFNVQDFSSANLKTLISDLKSAVNNREYSEIEQFSREFAAAVSGVEIIVKNGKRTIKVGNEIVDFDNAIMEIVNTINGVSTQSVPSSLKKAVLDMYEAVDIQLTGLFKQREMMEELARRGYKPEEFKRITDENNNKSRKKIKDIEEEQKNVADTRKNMFGEDNNSIGKTSLITQIANLKKAEEGVDLIEEQLEEIKSLQDAIFSFKADISAGLIDPNSVKGHISANQDRINSLEANIRAELDVIQDCKVPGLNLDIIKNAVNEDTDIRTYKAQDALDFIHNVGRGRTLQDVIELELDSTYKTVGKNIVKHDTSLKDPVKTDIEFGDKDAIDEYIKQFEERVSKLQKDKDLEEVLIIAREKGYEKYEKIHDEYTKAKDKVDKAKIKYVQDKDASGKPLFYQDDGHGNPDKTKPAVTTDTGHIKYKEVQAEDGNHKPLFLDADGNPTTVDTGNKYMVKEIEVGDPTTLLTGFDTATKEGEIASSDDIKNLWDAEIADTNKIKYNERRAILKKAGIGNPVTRLFRAVFALNPKDSAIRSAAMSIHSAPTIDTKKQEMLDKAKNTHVKSEARKALDEFEEKSSQEDRTEYAYHAISHRAEAHKTMQDGAYKVVSTTNEDAKKEIIGEIISGVSNASYGELAIIYGLTELTPEQRALIVNKHEFADELKNKTGVSSNPKTPVHREEHEI